MTELTIDQIRNLSGPISDHVFFTTDEGQQGLWQYDPESTAVAYPDNTGTILNTADDKVIRRVYSGTVNVKWFGATGDATVNDAPAIQHAIDALQDSGGTVFIPTGHYKITDTIQIRDGVSLIGEETQNNTVGYDTILKYEGTGIAIQCYKYEDSPGTGNLYTFSNVIIKGFFLYDDDNTGTIGLDLQGFRWCKLENVSVKGFNKGLHTNQNYYSTYKNLLFLDFREYGIHSENQDNNTLWEKVKVGDAHSTGVARAAKFSYAYNINLTDFSCETNTGHGVSFNNCKGVLVTGYYYEGTAEELVSAILLESCTGVSITGGSFQGLAHTRRGVYGSGTDNVMIFGNWFNGFTEQTIVNGSVVPGDNKNFLATNNQIDEISGEYDNLFTNGQGGGEMIGFRHIEWCMYDAAPPAGSWKKGDIFWRKTAEIGKPMGYICTTTGTPGTWVEFGQMGVRTTTAAPTLTPNFIGEEVLDTTNNKWYKSTGLTSGNWVALN